MSYMGNTSYFSIMIKGRSHVGMFYGEHVIFLDHEHGRSNVGMFLWVKCHISCSCANWEHVIFLDHGQGAESCRYVLMGNMSYFTIMRNMGNMSYFSIMSLALIHI